MEGAVMAKISDLVLEELNYDGPRTLEELTDRLKRHPADIRRALALLAEEGLVEGYIGDAKKASEVRIQAVRHG